MGMSKPVQSAVAPSSRPLIFGISALFGALAAAAAIMWIWFGTKVFFEMIATGIAYCF